jgi:uncharacterized protein YjbJ (UPF0337 family)
MGEIVNKSKGRIKQAIGALAGNRKLQREGRKDEFKGKVEGVAKKLKAARK